MKDIWKLSAIIKGCSVPFEKTLKFSENSSNFFKKVLKFFTCLLYTSDAADD